MKFYYLIFLTIGQFAQNSFGQSIIDLVFVDYGQQCARELSILPGVLPDWAGNIQCKNYNGSVGCDATSPGVPGTCVCNQGNGAYFDLGRQICLGKVGAICTAEKTYLVPEKLCTPNADCVPVQSEGHTVGTCQCRYGYKEKEDDGTCEVDGSIEEGDRSTPRTTTTTEAADRGPFELPLDLLLGIHVSQFSEACDGPTLFPILNHTFCNTHRQTVACVDKKCQCNMGSDDSEFDKEHNICVGLAGSYCLTRPNILGYKSCTAGADCFLENGLSSDYSFGTCQCLYGYDEKEDGTCERNPDIPNPSTPALTPPTPTVSAPTSPAPTGTPIQTTTPAAAAQISVTSMSIVSLMSISYYIKRLMTL